jgi:hypothetical protein
MSVRDFTGHSEVNMSRLSPKLLRMIVKSFIPEMDRYISFAVELHCHILTLCWF